jgi:hypothetical protein
MHLTPQCQQIAKGIEETTVMLQLHSQVLKVYFVEN